MNFGTIKNIYAKSLIDSYITESKKDANKNNYKQFIKSITESPILRTQFIVYKNIENGYFPSEISAVEYLKENISLFDVFDKKEIVKENEKISKGLKSVKSDKIHESLHNLIMLEKKAETINQLHESFEVLKDWLTTPKKVSENNKKNNINPKKFLEIVTQKYNQKYSNISEEEKKVLKTILSENEIEKENVLKDMIKETISLINKSLKEFGSNLDVKERLLDAKDVVYSLEYKKESFKEDLLKVYELKSSLS